MTPTYFQSKKNTCCMQLHRVVFCGMILEMGCQPVKGGCVDKYVFNSRGGCRRTKTPRRDGQKNAAQGKYAGPQVRQRMAHRSSRTRRVEEATRKSIQKTGSGKLNDEPVFSVALRTHPLIGTHQVKPVSQRYFMPIIATNRHELQRIVVRCRVAMGYEVAVREDLPL